MKTNTPIEFIGRLAFAAMYAEREAPFGQDFCMEESRRIFSGAQTEGNIYGRSGIILSNFMREAKARLFDRKTELSSSSSFEALVKSVHTNIWVGISEVCPGMYRKTDVTVGIHSPPRAFSLPTEMREWGLSAAHMRSESISGKLGKKTYVATVVSSFLRVHPFADLNWRTARILANILLLDAWLRLSELGENPMDFTKAARKWADWDISEMEKIL